MTGHTDAAEDVFHLGIKALIRNDAGQILLLQVNPAKLKGDSVIYWDLPGGRVQKGQTIADTLEREVAEETGIEGVEIGGQIGMTISNIRIPVSTTESVGLILGVYSCELPSGSTVALSDEHVAYDWFEPQEAASRLAIKYPAPFCDLIAVL